MITGLFTKILVATDGSDKNRAAVEEGVRIGRACGVPVHVVYVADISALESGISRSDDREYLGDGAARRGEGAGPDSGTWRVMYS